MLAGVAQGQQRRGLQPALLGGWREGAVGARCVLALGPELLPDKAQEEVAQIVGVQASGIVGRGGLDEAVALEGFGDAGKVGVVEAVLGDASEQQQGFERRVRCRRGIHAPDSTPRGTEGTAAALDKMNRRHDLRGPGPGQRPLLKLRHQKTTTTRRVQFAEQKHIPAARARRSCQFGGWKGCRCSGSLRGLACDRAGPSIFLSLSRRWPIDGFALHW